jgi:SPP1 family phage portal protein
MTKLRTDKDELTPADILDYIDAYQRDEVPKLDKLWDYYLGKNTTILGKQSPDPNNPDNRTPVPYGRKIITTFTGYAYRPKYITYKSDNVQYLETLQSLFDNNNEHIKTSLAGRNTAIFGMAYELCYIGEKAEARFAAIDPRQMILIYDNSIEPVKKMGIRFYITDEKAGKYKVFVYYANRTVEYDMTKKGTFEKGIIVQVNVSANYFEMLPIVAYYLGEEAQGIIEPVLSLIDDYDLLVSDSMNEFDRFAHAYLLLVKMSLSDQNKSSSPGMFQSALAMIKRRRVFEQLPDKDAVSFLTKNIPTDYIKFMTDLIQKQIHVQSHVPDLSTFADGLSGVAVDRMMFDFENVVSTAEAEFDTGLIDRIKLIDAIFAKTNKSNGGDYSDISIAHKRNKPVNTKEYAETAVMLSNAGFSRYCIVDFMPDEIVPDTEMELEREEEDMESAPPDVEAIPPPTNEDSMEPSDEQEPEEAEDGDR